ncbi:MAG TPA: TonB-dependent receptor [Pyrinomonadaceae bacterium]|jgi:outer membrane receptor protein involved in Fe transport
MKTLTTAIIVFACIFYVSAQPGDKRILRGKVTDEAGLPVDQAEIRAVSEAGQTVVCQNESEGKFTCAIDFAEDFRLEVKAVGFSILRQNIKNTQDFSQAIILRLSPESVREEVVVTANRTETRIGDTAASIVTLSKEEIQTTAAPTVDDALRQVAGFSLFRRSGSRNANPTSQGVSLRGVGASGASRSLVLFDGVPLNDAFGGWIQWNRVPPIAVERIEVLRGGASSLYGSGALSGTINILPRRTRENFVFSAEIYGGTQNTRSASTFFGASKNNFSADFVASIFQTKGYVPIDASERGAVDSFAGAKSSNLSARFSKEFPDKSYIFFKPTVFGEARTNGTPAQINRTYIRQFVLGGGWEIANPRIRTPDTKPDVSDLKFTWRIFGGSQTYDQTFSAVSADRNSETLNRVQRVPAQNLGFSSQLTGVFLKNQTFIIGFDAREVRGASDEIGLSAGRVTSFSGAGGREQTLAVFIQDFARIGSKLIVAGSVRYDDWSNFRAYSSTRAVSNNQTTTINFPDRNESAFSPQISALYQATENLSVFALVSKSFRAPTLNELYRNFRVGNVVTQANENLRAEEALNFESGLSFSRKKIYFRGNYFFTQISDPIANVTLSTTPNLITRQRRNAGKTRASGLEIEFETRIQNFRFSLGYLLTDSRVTKFPSNPALENLFVPQVARQQFTFQANYAKNTWTLAFQGRASGAQFDDDLNAFRLEPYFQLDAFVAKKLRENLQIFAAVENVFDSRYSIGRTPVRTVSSPINFRIGFRWK